MHYKLEADSILALLTIKLGMKEIKLSEIRRFRDELLMKDSDLLIDISEDSIDSAMINYPGLFRDAGEKITKVEDERYRFYEKEVLFDNEFLAGLNKEAKESLDYVLKNFLKKHPI